MQIIKALQAIVSIWRIMLRHLREEMVLEGLRSKNKTVSLYKNVKIDANSSLGKFVTIFTNVQILNSQIGNHTFVQSNSVIINTKVGKFCSIAADVRIGLGRHPISFVSSHPAFHSVGQPIQKTYSDKDYFEPFKETMVGNDVWIGVGVKIIDGCNIGTGSIIGAGAVVTKDVPPYAIVAGVPAKIMRYRFEPKICQELLESAWWDFSEEQLKMLASKFRNPIDFLNSIK